MYKEISVFVSAALCILLMAGCGPESVTPQTTAPAPVLLGVSPENGAVGIVGEKLNVVFTMDQNVRVSSEGAASVSVDGGAEVSLVNAYGENVTVTLAGLEEGSGKMYTVTIPAGTIRGYNDGQEATAQIQTCFTMKYEEPETDYGRNPVPTLSNPDASAEAAALYSYLLSLYGTKSLSGAMGDTAWGTSYTDYIYEQTGYYPAIVGFDYLFSNWPAKAWSSCPDYSDISVVKAAWESGNIIQIGWHWCVPPAEGTTDLNSYSYNTKLFSVTAALTEGTWQNETIKSQIATIAGYLKLLRDEGIPVLFRPLHEAAGDYGWGAWFWWGYEGAEPCKKLWAYLYDTLTEDYGLDNLIWVWTAQTSDTGSLAKVSSLKEWYPGDDRVDIVGADLYINKKFTTQSSVFRLVNNSVCGRKMVVLSEFGNLLDIEAAFEEDAPWGYFMNWNNYENGSPVLYCKNSDGTYSWNNTAEDWKTVLSGSHIINRK